jgi:hypothetical protein
MVVAIVVTVAVPIFVPPRPRIIRSADGATAQGKHGQQYQQECSLHIGLLPMQTAGARDQLRPSCSVNKDDSSPDPRDETHRWCTCRGGRPPKRGPDSGPPLLRIIPRLPRLVADVRRTSLGGPLALAQLSASPRESSSPFRRLIGPHWHVRTHTAATLTL